MRLLALALCLMLAACAAGGAKKAAAPPSSEHAPSTAGAALADDPREQIRELEGQIIAARTQLELDDPGDVPTDAWPQPTPMGAQPYSANPACRPAASDTCKTSCTLSDSICGNADKICRIAQDLAGDAWATNKCAKANQTCEASRTKCCGCV